MTKKAVTESIKVADIKTDPALQNRDTSVALIEQAAIKELKQHVNELAADIKAKGLKQPIIVYKIKGEEGYTLVSGHHRLEATTKLRRTKISAKVYEGTRSEAWAYSKFCNLERIKPLGKRELSENAWNALTSAESNYFRDVVVQGSNRILAGELKVNEKTIRRMIECMSFIITDDRDNNLNAKDACTQWSKSRPPSADLYSRWVDAVKLLSDREREYDPEFTANSDMVKTSVSRMLSKMHGLESLSPEEVIHGLEAITKELKQGKDYPVWETLQFISEEEDDSF